MKYKTKIIPENGGYVGYAILNEEVVFTTNTHKDTIMAARELSSKISAAIQGASPVPVQRFANSSVQSSSTNNLVPSTRSTNPPLPSQNEIARAPAPSNPSSSNAPAPRRCCGR